MLCTCSSQIVTNVLIHGTAHSAKSCDTFFCYLWFALVLVLPSASELSKDSPSFVPGEDTHTSLHGRAVDVRIRLKRNSVTFGKPDIALQTAQLCASTTRVVPQPTFSGRLLVLRVQPEGTALFQRGATMYRSGTTLSKEVQSRPRGGQSYPKGGQPCPRYSPGAPPPSLRSPTIPQCSGAPPRGQRRAGPFPHSNEPQRDAARVLSGVVVLFAPPSVRLAAGVTRCPGMPWGRAERGGERARAREAEGARAAHGAAAAAIVGAAGECGGRDREWQRDWDRHHPRAGTRYRHTPVLASRGPVAQPHPRRGALPAAAGQAGREPPTRAALTFPVFEAPAARSRRGGGGGS